MARLRPALGLPWLPCGRNMNGLGMSLLVASSVKVCTCATSLSQRAQALRAKPSSCLRTIRKTWQTCKARAQSESHTEYLCAGHEFPDWDYPSPGQPPEAAGSRFHCRVRASGPHIYRHYSAVTPKQRRGHGVARAHCACGIHRSVHQLSGIHATEQAPAYQATLLICSGQPECIAVCRTCMS